MMLVDFVVNFANAYKLLFS